MPPHPVRAVICVLALAAAPWLAAAPAAADDTTEAIRRAESFYKQGKLGEAFTQLEEAATLVARRLSAEYARTFSPTPAGWRAEAAQYSTKGKVWIGRGLSVRQNFFEKDGKGVLTAQLIVDDQGIIEAIRRIKSAPAHAKAAKRTLVPVAGAGDAFVKFDQSRGVGDLYVFVAGRFYITITGQRVENRAFLTNLLSAWDFAGLKRAAGVD